MSFHIQLQILNFLFRVVLTLVTGNSKSVEGFVLHGPPLPSRRSNFL